MVALMGHPLRFNTALAQDFGWRVFLLEFPNAVLDFGDLLALLGSQTIGEFLLVID